VGPVGRGQAKRTASLPVCLVVGRHRPRQGRVVSRTRPLPPDSIPSLACSTFIAASSRQTSCHRRPNSGPIPAGIAGAPSGATGGLASRCSGWRSADDFLASRIARGVGFGPLLPITDSSRPVILDKRPRRWRWMRTPVAQRLRKPR
jgi:hypothetical protein